MNARTLPGWVLSNLAIDPEQVHPEDREAFDRYLAHDSFAGANAVMIHLSSSAGFARVRYRDFEFRMPEARLSPLDVVPIDFDEQSHRSEPSRGLAPSKGRRARPASMAGSWSRVESAQRMAASWPSVRGNGLSPWIWSKAAARRASERIGSTLALLWVIIRSRSYSTARAARVV